jgi:hypothetical protein
MHTVLILYCTQSCYTQQTFCCCADCFRPLAISESKARNIMSWVQHIACVVLLCAPRGSAILPPFSWDTVPVFWHAANYSGLFNDAAIKFIAHSGFASATIEKAQGLYGRDNSTTYAEDRILQAARQLKAANSELAVVAYFNSVLNWPYYRLAAEMAADPSKALLNTSGEPVLLSGDPAFPQPKNGMEVFDFSQASVQDWFVNACTNLTKTGAVDGCFQDRAGEEDFPNV